MNATNSETWTYPKGSGIKIHCLTNQTTQNGERLAFGESFMVAVPNRLTGQGRLRRQFDNRRSAEDFAMEQWTGAKSLGEQFFEVSSSERRDAVASLDILRPLNLSLLTVAKEFVDAHVKLGGRPVAEAVDYFVRHKPAGMPVKMVTEVHEELLTAKRTDGASAVYLKDLEFRIGKFTETFQGPIAELTATGINDWLRKLKCAPRSRNNYRRAIKTLFTFAEAHDYLTKGHVDFAKVPKAKEPDNEIEIFTPEEMSKLLTAAQLNPNDLPPGTNRRYATGPGLLPLLLLGGFAGLRTAEVERQRWEDINLERGFIRVTGTKGGTAAKRLVPITDNLKAWLSPLRRESGPVIEIVRLPGAIARLAERAGVTWKHNALRHSFISNRVAETQNVAQVSLEAGNSPQMIHRHYRELVSPAEAKVWFAITPSGATNVIQLPTPVVA